VVAASSFYGNVPPAHLTNSKQRGCVPNHRLTTNVASVVFVAPQGQNTIF